MDVHVNRSREATEEVLCAVVGAELQAFRAELMADKAKHARFVADGYDGVKVRMRRALREVVANADGRCDTASLRMGHEDTALVFWSAACYDWRGMYGTEDPRKFLDAFQPKAPPAPDPDEKFDVTIRIDPNMPGAKGWMQRNLNTSRQDLEGITLKEWGELAKYREPAKFEESGRLMQHDDPVKVEDPDYGVD